MNNYFIIPNLKNTFINIFMFSFYLINYKIIAYYAKKRMDHSIYQICYINQNLQ